MGDEAPMWTAQRAAPTVPTIPITKPNLNKEIPGKLLHMIKDLTFDGKNDSNPIEHMESFVDVCDLFKTEEGRDDAIHLRVFPLTLIGEAKAWLRSLEPSSITTWEGLQITADLLEPFEELEREFRKRNKKKSKVNKVRPRALIFEMGDKAPMWTTRRAAPTVPTNPITKPNLNKEIPGKLLHMIKDLTFDGKNDSNPIVHMENFVDICDLFKTEADRDDAIRLRVFPLTLTGEARAWLRSLEPSSITTWEGLRSKFLSRFFPPSKIDKLRAEIRSFQQQDGETISEAWERFKHLLNSCPSHELNKSEQVQTFYIGLAYSSRATLDSSAGGVFMYKTPTEGYKLLEDMLIHNIDWRTDKRLQIPRMAGKISTDFDPSDELAAMKNQQVKFERKIEELIKSVHALQVGCEECNGPHLTKDCPNRPMMTPEEVNYLNRGDYQGRWNNNRNFIPRPPGFFAPTQQIQRPDGEPRVFIEDRIVQFMDAQKKLNDEVSSYLCNHQSTIQNLELQVGRVSQMLSERTQGELLTQTQVNPKVENVKSMLMMTGEPSKKKWTDIYTKKYVETDSESEPDYDSEGFTVSFEHLRLKVPEASSDDDEEEDGKQGGYAEFVIPKKEDKGKEKENEKAPKMGVKKIIPTDCQYRGVNGYLTKPLGIAEGVPIRIGNFVYYTDFVIANLPQNTEIPIILGRSFLHTAQVNTDMRNQVTSLGYGDNRIYFDPNGEPIIPKVSLTQETGGTSGANEGEQPAEWTAYSGYQDLSNRLSKMSLSYGRHHQHMEYNTTEALHQANWQSGVMNQMASHFGIQPNTAYAPSPYWPYSEDAPPASSFSSKHDFRYGLRGRNESESPSGAVTADLLEPFEEPEREFRKRNKKKTKANKVRPRALIFKMGDKAPMWTARRTAPTAEMMRFAFESFLLHLPEKPKRGYDHWSQAQSPLGKDFTQTPSKFVPESRIEKVQTFYSGLAYSSRATLDSSAGGVIMYKTPTEGFKLLEDMLIHNIDWRTDKRLQIPRMAGKISTDFDPSDELAAMKNQQVGCEECNGPHLTKDCLNRPMMTPEEVGRVSQLLSERTQGELPTQTQVNLKVENVKPMLMMTGEPSKKKWTDIYTKKYVESDSESDPDYATDYDSEGFTISFEHLGLKGPVSSSDDEEEDGKQGGYAEFVIPKKEDKGKEKEKEKAAEDELTYIAPIKHDPGSYRLPISCHKFKGLALVDTGAALNMMPVGYCRKMGVKKIMPTDYQYRGVNGYMTKPLGIAEGVPIRIGNCVYLTDFIIANLPKDTEIPIILGRAFLHTAQVNTDMRNQVTSLGYGDKRIYFDPNGEPVTHLDEPYEDPCLAYKKNTNHPLLPHEYEKKKEDYPNPLHQKEQVPNGSGPSKKEHRKKKGSSARRNHTEEIDAKIEQIRRAMEFLKSWKQ
ncbi:hypothetical protein OSB04_002704 [Centaurea solstitialis]|uniref:Retrotransposon gag domain-containing protein n=1 Tax=Centaurea solstitialis TaxID=347529 RepID=A0AA38UBN5_9ASTR|nr:hypothetical protein OSB04_002704 [Centaurea solstitialis]